MTGLIDEILEENLFQNNKMAAKVTNVTTKATNLQMNIIDDILKKASDLKQTAKDLEDSAHQLKKNKAFVRTRKLRQLEHFCGIF